LLKFGTDLVAENHGDIGYSGENQLITNAFLLILEQIKGFDPKKIPSKSFKVFIVTLHEMSRLFEMLRHPSDCPESRELTIAILLVSTRFFDTIASVFLQPAIISSFNDECLLMRKKPFYFYLAELVFCFVVNL
jgi:hypothetical protein